MRLAIHLDSRLKPAVLACFAAFTLALCATTGYAQEPASADVTTVANNVTTTGDEAAASLAGAPANLTEAVDTTPNDTATLSSDTANDNATSDMALDDQVLSKQRGGKVGMLMVAATPQFNRGSSVTLWDEIAPPTPSPSIPVDAARAAQDNVANFTRR